MSEQEESKSVVLTEEKLQQMLAAATEAGKASVVVRPESSLGEPTQLIAPEEKYVYVENLAVSPTRFTTNDDGFYLTAHGFVGSVIQIKQSLSRNSFVQRAVERGRVRILEFSDALVRMDELIIPSVADEHSELLKALETDASTPSRYLNPDLPDEAEPRKSITVEELFGSSKDKEAKTVQRSSDPVDTPLDPASVLQAREYGD